MNDSKKHSFNQIVFPIIALLLLILVGGAWFFTTAPLETKQPEAGSNFSLPAQKTPNQQSNPIATHPLPASTNDTSPAVATPSPALVSATVSPTPPPTATPTWLRYTIQAGDILGQIALDYGTTVEAIMTLNEVSDPTRLQIGQELLIPVEAPPTPSQPTPTRPQPSLTAIPATHTIQAGDTLLAIAATYSSTVEAIMIINGIGDAKALRVGDTLTIPVAEQSISSEPITIHTITPGDTLLGLATLYRSTLDDIFAANPDVDPTTLQVGQDIIIPLTLSRLNPEADPLLPRLTAPAVSPENLRQIEQQLFAATNIQREIHGVPPYAFAEDLAVVARTHAQDMVARGYFAHYSPEGMGVRDRVREHGLNLSWVGENIQRNTEPFEQAGQTALDWFMGSPDHRNNILHERFDRVGVGVAEGPPGWYTLVMVFGGE